MKKAYKIYSLIWISFLLTDTMTAQNLVPVPIQNFLWAKSTGDVSLDGGNSVAVDIFGNVHYTGFFEGTVDFDPDLVEIHNLDSEGSLDIFVCKLDASGNFIWAKNLGGADADAGHSIAVDADGFIHITGYFTNTADFDPDDVGVFDLISNGEEDIFVAKLDPSGNLVWAKNLGGALDDHGNSTTLDGSGNVYTTGFFQDVADFDPDLVGIRNLPSAGGKDIFISKLDASGNLAGAARMGGSDADIGQSITLDESENVYSTGSFMGMADFNPKAGTDNLFSAGGTDIFISKLDALGNFVGARRMGGPLDDGGNSIALGIAGNIYSTGFFGGTADFDPDPVATFNLSATGGYLGGIDVFVSKLDTSGNFKWAKNMGGSGLDSAFSINVDNYGHVYTTGYFTGIAADFDPGAGISNLESEGGLDVFISKLSASGKFKWAKSMGGDGNDSGKGIAVDAYFNVHTTGYFDEDVDFDPGTGVDDHYAMGFSDIFVQKLGNDLLATPPLHTISPLVLFPNPTTQNVTLDLGQRFNTVTLNVRNLSGALVSTRAYKKTDKIDFSIKSGPGMYIVEVLVDGGKKTSLKVIKQ